MPKGTGAAVKVTTRSKMWYGRRVPGYPSDYLPPLSTDKAAARRLLEDLVREHEHGRAGLPDEAAGRRPLADHLDQFLEAVAAGLANRRGKRLTRRPTAERVDTVRRWVGRVQADLKLERADELGPGAAVKFGKYLVSRVSARVEAATA